MLCDRCKEVIEAGEERERYGQHLCEDCYLDALSPARTCDPWAVHSAKSFEQAGGEKARLNENQNEILRLLKENGGTMDPQVIIRQLGIKPSDLEREIAALRHMERVKGELRDGRKFLRLW
ncbi:hypothetical protein DENIS_2700 [Desulfonema ishimotonii]|uniref:Uncharacterized protein n=1 Tax=Desulfonema ishimotonii TaxID=45657 RepID=A0A401FXM8_9BACT|nr:hypothetical protein [Desulfonema ishimotonii]GBC61738.1 hypothetical protein DENIS_2700 [Desulfonema ishimotonii]